jgi:hypothetical protein
MCAIKSSKLSQQTDWRFSSSVTLGNSLNLVLLLDGVGVSLTDTLGGVDDFVGEGLWHGLVGSEARLSGSLAHEVDSLVDSSEWGDINSLSSDGTTGTDSGRVLSASTLNNSLEEDSEWVLTSEKVNDFKSLLKDSDSLLLLTVLSSHTDHDHINESLSDWAWDLSELLLLVSTGGVWEVHLGLGGLDWEVVDQGHFWALDTLIRPLTEKFWDNCEFSLVFNDDFRFYEKKDKILMLFETYLVQPF